MKEIVVTEIRAEATPGATITECLKECLVLAASEWQNVILRFNGKEYKIYVNDLLAAVKSPSIQ